MIKTTKSEIYEMKLTHNRVVVEILRMPNELILSEDIKMYLDYTFSHEMHAPTRAKVVNICDSLNTKTMNWLTKKEIQVGDIAIYNYVAAIHCWIDDPSRTLFDETNTMYFILDYDDIFCVKRKEDLIPVNGYVLCAPVKNELKSRLILPDFLKRKVSDRFGVVRYLGTRNEKYFLIGENGQTERKDLRDPYEVAVGDIVVFDKACDLPLEYDIHRSTEPLFRMHRCNLKAVIQKEFLPQLGISVQTRQF